MQVTPRAILSKRSLQMSLRTVEGYLTSFHVAILRERTGNAYAAKTRHSELRKSISSTYKNSGQLVMVTVKKTYRRSLQNYTAAH